MILIVLTRKYNAEEAGTYGALMLLSTFYVSPPTVVDICSVLSFVVAWPICCEELHLLVELGDSRFYTAAEKLNSVLLPEESRNWCRPAALHLRRIIESHENRAVIVFGGVYAEMFSRGLGCVRARSALGRGAPRVCRAGKERTHLKFSFIQRRFQATTFCSMSAIVVGRRGSIRGQ